MSIQESDESELEFWADYEGLLKFPGKPTKFFLTVDDIKSAFDKKSPISSIQGKIDIWKIEYYEDKLRRIREATVPQIQISTILAKNEVRKEFDSKADQLKEVYSRKLSLLAQNMELLKCYLLDKEDFNHVLMVLLSEVHLLFSETSILNVQNRKYDIQKDKNEKEKKVLADEIVLLRQQICYLKDICEMMQEEKDKTDIAKAEVEARLLQTIEQHKIEKEKLEESIKAKENQADCYKKQCDLE
jgi:hypothetical protein